MESPVVTYSSPLERFLLTARGDNKDSAAVECGSETWSYAALDRVSDGLADQLGAVAGSTVAAVSGNHPYILALLLATWKAGATFAPLDPGAPADLLSAMLDNIQPAIVVYQTSDKVLLTRGALLPDPVYLRQHA